MAIKAKISLDKSELSQGLNQAKQEAQKAGNQIQSSLSSASGGLAEASKSASKFTSALQAVSRVAGGLGSQVASMAAGFVKALKNPVTAIMAIVAALVAVGAKLYEVFKDNAEEAIKITEARLKRVKDMIAEQEASEEEFDGYISRLKEINKLENKSLEAKREAAVLLEKIKRKYGEIGLYMDKEGVIHGLDDGVVEEAKAKKDYQEKIRLSNEAIDAESALIAKKLKEATGHAPRNT